MAYGLRAYWSEENHNGVTDYLYIYQDGYVGSSLQITASTGFTFKHQEISSDSNEGYLNPTYNKILMGVLDWNVWGKDASTKQLIEDIKTGAKKEFYIQWMQGTTGNIMWQGYASGRILNYPEAEKYLAKLQFKDFEVLKTQEYTPTDTRQKVIQTIADLISELGLSSLRYSGYVLQTYTSWQAQGTTLSDDFLNQVYHDTIQLRNFGRLGDEDDTSISVYDALKFTAAPQLLIYQMNGAFNVVQLSAFEDGQNVLRSDYLLNGTAAGSVTVNLEETIYTDKALGLPTLIDSSQVTTYPAIQSAIVEYDHKSLNANITVPQTVTISTPSEQKYTMNVRLSGDESIVFTARNISRVTVPYANHDVFNDTDVDIATDTIDVTPGLNIDQKVRFENTSGSLPGGLSAGVTYYAKPFAGTEYYFDTFPNRLNNPIDITSDGGAGSTTKVLTIEELTLKNAEFALTLGANFLDTGTGSFITPGLSYTGMSSSIINLTAANINTTTDSVDFNGHGLKNGQLVIFTNTGGSLPGGIDADTFYYVVNSSTNSFQISDSYGGSFKTLTSTGSGAHTVQRASMVRALSNTLKLAEYVGDLSFEITDLPPDQTVELNLHLLPTRVLESEIASGYIDETLWLDTVVQFIDPSNPESTSIVYKLEQNTQVASDDITLPAIRYGDGPYVWSRSAYRTSTNLADITTGWKRRLQASYVNFEELLLKEVLDTQRSRPTKINANIIGDYNPVSVGVYDGNYYAYVGGTYNGRWRPTLVQINIQTATDTLTTVKRIDQSGNQGVIVTPPETEGLTESEGDARYLRIINDLSDVNNVGTSRTNLGLGTADNVTFGTLELGDNTSIDGTIKMWLSSLPDDANITLDNNGGVARFRLDSDTVVEGDLWVDNEVTTARLRTPEITNLAGTAAVWSTSSAIWDTSSLTWTNDVILLNGGISISQTLEVVGDTNLQGNVTLDNDLTVLGTTNLASITSSALTAGRVVLAGTSGVLEDSANLTFNGSLLDVTGQISVDDSAASSGNSFEVFGANGNVVFPYTGETVQLTATTGNAVITSGANNLEINAAKTFINQATDVDGALYALTTLRVDGETDLNSKLVVSDSTASPGDYAIEAASNGAITANFNATHPSQAGIRISSFANDRTDLIWDSTTGVALRAHANSNLSFYTEDTGVDTLRLAIGNGTGISTFYGEQFNFGNVSGGSGKVKVITGTSGQGQFILNDSGTDQVNLSWNNAASVYDVKSLGNIRFQTQGSTVAGMWDNGDLIPYQSIIGDSFTKGTGNTGWVVDGAAGFAIEEDGSAKFNAYFDTLTVRGTLRVFELIAKQISTIGGTELMTAGNGVIESVSGSLGFETVTLEDPTGIGGNAFASGDLVVIQRFNPNNPGTTVKSEWREVVTSSFTTITLQDSSVALSLAGAPAGTSALEPGDYIVIFGNWNVPSFRGNLIYRSVLGNPIVRVQEDIQTYAEFTSPINSTRIAYGDINGFGGLATATYGFFAGTNTDNHVTITSTGMQFRNASDVLAELASNRFVVGDATSYVRFDGATSKIEMAADTFNLATTNLTIDSANEIITLGTSPNVVSIGKIGTSPDQFGISLDATNYWYNSGGNTYISIGSATDYLQFDTSSGNLDIATNNFALTANGIEVDSAGTGIADPNVILTSSSLSVDFKNATSGSPVISPNFSISDTERIRILQIVFDYDISGGDAAYDIRIEPQFRNASTSVWSNPAMNLPIISYPAAANSYFNTNTLSATLTDESTGFITQFKIVSGVSSVSDKVAIYIVADENSIDYSTYDAFRFRVYHQGGAEVIGSFTADLYIRKYAASTGINPDGFTIRHCDTLWQETDVLSDGLPVRQDKSLIFV